MNIDYLPFIEDVDGNRWEVLGLNFCVDFGGRQAQIEVQNLSTNQTKDFTYYYQSKLLLEAKGEIVLVKGVFSQYLESILSSFDRMSKES